MERKKIAVPQADRPESSAPRRRQSILPTALRHPEIVPGASEEQEILTTPTPTSNPHTGNRKKRLRFDERYTRLTTYVENATLARIRELYASADIDSFTAFLNAAIQEYLSEHFQI